MGVEYAPVRQSVHFPSRAIADYQDVDVDPPHYRAPAISWYELAKRTLVLAGLLLSGLVLGFCVGRKHPGAKMDGGGGGAAGGTKVGGLLSPSAFVGESEFSPWGCVCVYVCGGEEINRDVCE